MIVYPYPLQKLCNLMTMYWDPYEYQNPLTGLYFIRFALQLRGWEIKIE